jgi:predicted dehydrogenase
MAENALYKVAIIGCGRRAAQHSTGLKQDPRCKVVGLADLNEEAAKGLNQEFGFEANVYGDYKEMLAKERPDLVISCLWTGLHLPVFRDCAEAGVKAYLSEKPMAPTWGESVEMGRIAESTGCLLAFCHQRRFAQGNRLVREWIKEGRIGDIQRLDLYSPPHLLDCGTHTFDQAMSFMDETPARWVLGAVDTSEIKTNFGIPAEIMAVGTIVFQNGVRAGFQIGGPDKDLGSGVRVLGTKGFIEVNWDGLCQKAVSYDDPSWKPEPVKSPPGEQMSGVIRHIVDSLQNGTECELSHVHALRAAEIIYSLYESVRRHARIELPLTGVTDHPFKTMLEQGEFGTK